ncbi:MAG: IS30 family transposase [Alphaproteobacteria bacterium]|nr:IS30 family transposase [Alphaproteobacteria bacterium]MDE2492542.1 IS30 family transposase [Alphaproteobacteria bacterium]
MVLHGGFAQAPRRRAAVALRVEERGEISRAIAARRSIRPIAREIGRSPSTLSREIRRNWGSQGYRAKRADRLARERALRPKPCRLTLHRQLRWRVVQKLLLQWSSEQISGCRHSASLRSRTYSVFRSSPSIPKKASNRFLQK